MFGLSLSLPPHVAFIYYIIIDLLASNKNNLLLQVISSPVHF